MKRIFTAFGLASILAGQLEGADATAYGVLKGQIYTQTPGGAPVPAGSQGYVVTEFVSVSDLGEIDGADVRSPLGTTATLDYDASALDELRLSFSARANTQAQLNATYPSGTYTFLIDAVNDLFTVASLNVGAESYPSAIPTIVNLAAAQTANADNDFTLTWSPFSGATANDKILLEIDDSSGFPVFATSSLSQSAALPGSLTSVTIPGGTLSENETYTAHLRFVKVGSMDTSSYPGATGMVAFYNENQFTIKTGSGGTGGGDTTPPTLVFSFPSAGSTGVAPQSPMQFMFSEAMQSQQSIAWNAELNPANFIYFWGNDKKSLTALYQGGFPSGTKITWRLNPTPGGASNFKDVAGNELPAGIFFGDFTTSGGTTPDPTNNNPNCRSEHPVDPGYGSYSLFKGLNYLQTNNAPPVIDPELGTTFGVSMMPRTNQTYTSASVTLPNGSTLALSNFFGSSFFLFQQFATQAALDSSFPNGAYVLRAQPAGAAPVAATLNLPPNAYPPVPQVLNLIELQAMNTNQNFTLRWNPYTGAGQFDMIALEVHTESGSEVFYAPDFCLPRPLPNTATSIVIPAGTFSTSGNYEGTLTFSRLAASDTNSIALNYGSAGISTSTHFTFQVGTPASGEAPKWTDIHRNPDASVEMTLSGPANKVYAVEGSTDMRVWVPALTTNSVSGTVTYRDAQAGTTKYRFFRGRML